MFGFKKDIRDLQRFQQIMLVLFEEGLGYYITKSKLGHHLPLTKQLTSSIPLTNIESQAQALRRAFERLGPTFVKFGQLLSLRPDLVPKEYSREFEKLQDHVPSFPFEQVQQIIEQDFKKPLSAIFASIETTPLACASMAQVHKVKLKNGITAVVKVQRPHIKEIIDADLDILFLIAYSLEKHSPEIQNYRPVEIVKEFAIWTRRELNFEIEAGNAIRLREEMKKNKQVLVPKIYTAYSSPRVLTMDLVSGVKIDNLAGLKRFHLDRKKIAMIYFTAILEQALLHGFFHADPHPANIFVQKNGKLIFLDFGIMGELTVSDRKKIIRFISSLSDRDPEWSLEIIISLAKKVNEDFLPEFKQIALPILEESYRHSIGEKSMGHALYEIISLGARYGVNFDPNHVLIAKAIYQAEGLGLKLNSEFKVAAGLQAFADIYLQERYSASEIMKRFTSSMRRNRDLLLDLPDHLVKIIERLEKGSSPQSNDYSQQLEQFEEHLEYLNRRRNMGIVIISLFVASGFFYYTKERSLPWGVEFHTFLLIIALLLFFYFLLSIKKWRREIP